MYNDDPSSLVYALRINAGIGSIVIGLFLSDVEDQDCRSITSMGQRAIPIVVAVEWESVSPLLQLRD